jgi:S1-C subfamily serine protease
MDAVSLNVVDWIALGVIAFSALGGLRRGLVLSAFSFAGLALGAYAGSRVAPHLLHGGARSPWTPFAGLIGALAGATLLSMVTTLAGSVVRGGLRITPLRIFDSFAGLLLGAGMGVVLVWVLGATALLVPGQTTLRRDVQRSAIVRRLDEAVPPRRLLHLLARIDPFPSIAGPALPTQPISPRIAGNANVRRAAADVVRVLGTACGIGVEGSGWFATRHFVVTAAHVVAGERDTVVQIPNVAGLHRADVIAYDPRNDVAVLRVRDASVRVALRAVDPRPGAAVAIVGYPQNEGLQSAPGRIGRTTVAVTQDAYGRGPVERTITAVAGRIEHGNSGGPAIDARGNVEAMIFAARLGAPGGYGVPAAPVRRALASASRPVSTGACAAG